MRAVLTLVLTLCAGGGVAQERKPAGVSQAIRDARTYADTGHYLGEDKIMGGTFAKAGDNPWQVALVLSGPPNAPRQLFCGGSTIGSNIVITAAHCVDQGTPPGAVDAIVGATSLTKDGKRVRVRSIWIDPDYGKVQERAHDVAILQLTEDVSVLAPAIELARPSDDASLKEGLPVRVTGWGAPSAGGGAVRDLRTVNLEIISTDRCNDPVIYDGLVGASMVCAGWPKGGRNSCQGDSGGPMTSVIDGKRRLLGIVSWGRDCGLPDKYGVYARVPVLDWARVCAADQVKCLDRRGKPR
jgi:secreted trypsin-like serine protease